MTRGSASGSNHTLPALKGGSSFILQQCPQGFFCLVDLPDGLWVAYNPKTKKPWSRAKSAIHWTKRILRRKSNARHALVPINGLLK